VRGEGTVMVDGAYGRPGVEGDGEDSGEAERYAGELGDARPAPQLHIFHPA